MFNLYSFMFTPEWFSGMDEFNGQDIHRSGYLPFCAVIPQGMWTDWQSCCDGMYRQYADYQYRQWLKDEGKLDLVCL